MFVVSKINISKHLSAIVATQSITYSILAGMLLCVCVDTVDVRSSRQTYIANNVKMLKMKCYARERKNESERERARFRIRYSCFNSNDVAKKCENRSKECSTIQEDSHKISATNVKSAGELKQQHQSR